MGLAGLVDALGVGAVVPATVGGVVVGLGETGDVDEAAGALGFGAAGGTVAFGLRDSTRVLSRFTSSSRSFLLVPSFMAWTVLLTWAS
ncbi:hypothetical protein [Mycobacterium interjectum]|uniref:hypothetical protein n=1 Tax=Mycobacterium interjectum TaxID=33895 RepID=UPI000836B313|nr:hypothetical protein [Mycobacterium interjectum]